jgi:hypothetical protein
MPSFYLHQPQASGRDFRGPKTDHMSKPQARGCIIMSLFTPSPTLQLFISLAPHCTYYIYNSTPTLTCLAACPDGTCCVFATEEHFLDSQLPSVLKDHADGTHLAILSTSQWMRMKSRAQLQMPPLLSPGPPCQTYYVPLAQG